MSGIRSHKVAAALTAALLFCTAGAAVAAPPGDDPGDEYSDLVIALRDVNGVPVLDENSCVQPISYTAIPEVVPVTNDANGREAWRVPLVGGADEPCDPQPEYAAFVSEVELERLNLGRVPDDFFDRKLGELEARFDAADDISLDFAGRITTDIIGDVDEDGKPIPPAAIDASPEQQAMYGKLMTTGTVPGLDDAPLDVEGFDPWMLSAVGLGSGGSKGVSVTVDAVEYYNRIRGIPAMYDAVNPPSSVWNLEFLSNSPADEERFVDLSEFSYDRSKVFPGCGTYFDISTLKWSVQPIADLAGFSDLPSVAVGGVVDNVAGFAQMADDVRAAILFNEVNDRTLFFIDRVGQNTCDTQIPPAVEPSEPGELITSIDPVRLVDTRPPWVADDGRFAANGPVVGERWIEVPIAGREGVRIDAKAAVINVTAAGATGRGYLSVYPCGDRPEYSSLNYGTDHAVANELIAGLSANGTVCIFASTTTNVIVDAVGYVPVDSDYEPNAPTRLVDTRPPWVADDGRFTADGPVVGGTEIEVPIAGREDISINAKAAVINVTAAGATGRGYLSVYPCGDRPEYSSLNYGTDHAVANELIAGLSANGTVCIFASTTTNVIVDAVGNVPVYADYEPDDPTRLVDTRIPWVADDGRFTADGPVIGGTEIEVDIAGRGGVTEDAKAAVVNVTAAGAAGRGYLSVYPCGDRPEYSSLNYGTDHAVANELITKLSAEGTVCIFASTTTNVIVDAVGHL